MSKALEALQDLRYDVSMSQDIDYKEGNDKCDIIEKELKALEIIKKYAKNDGWSNGWVIMFWQMKEKELKKVGEVLKNE